MDATTVTQGSRISPDIIASFVLNCFGLSITEFKQELFGYSESVVWQFVAADQLWFIKLYAPFKSSIADVVDEATLYQHLATRGLNAPTVHRTLTDDLAQELRIGDVAYPAMIMKSEVLRVTRPSTICEPEMFTVAQTVARLHMAVLDYPFLDRLAGHAKSHSLRAALTRSARQLKQWGRRIAHRSNVTSAQSTAPYAMHADARARLHTGVAALRAQFEAHARYSYDIPTNLRKTLIHGDIALHHTPFLPNQTVYLYDFADRSWARIIDELVILAAYLYTVDDISFSRWEQLIDWMFQGYTSVAPLTAKDYAAFQPILIRRLLDELTYLWDLSGATARRLPWSEIARRHRLAQYLLQTA